MRTFGTFVTLFPKLFGQMPTVWTNADFWTNGVVTVYVFCRICRISTNSTFT